MEQESKIAQATFELENNVQTIDADSESFDSIYLYDSEEQQAILDAKPWKNE